MAKKQDSSTQMGMRFQGDLPTMPEGYYSGDKPNPNLRAFVEAHMKEKPYDPVKDDYDVPAFDIPIDTTKATAIYNMHTYWSKKPHDAIRQYIRHYTIPGDLVLDSFCGSGGTALAALMEGRKAIAIDRSPAATFITKNYCTQVNVVELRKAFDELRCKVEVELDWIYETHCDRCGGKATTAYTVYSQIFVCPRCLKNIPLFDCIEVEGETAKGLPKTINACPHCYNRGIVEEISTRAQKFGAMPVLVSYICENGCKPTRGERRYNDEDNRKREYFEKYDLGKIKEIEAKEILYWYPKDRMMHSPENQQCWGLLYRPGSANPERACDLYTKPSLWALSTILHNIRSLEQDELTRSLLEFAFQSILLNTSLMYQYRSNLKGGTAKGTYYMPPNTQVMNVWRSFADKFNDIINAITSITFRHTGLIVSTQSAANLEQIRSSSVDYIFTDPPYSWKVQYGELNFIWEAWLGFDTNWHAEEIIVNEFRGKSEDDWAKLMSESMAECYRVLKPGRWISLCYHDTSEGTWSVIQDLMAECGFIVDMAENALFIDTEQKSWKQLVADKVNKRDLVINFRKPRPGEVSQNLTITGDEDETTFHDKVHAVIRDYLTTNPGSTKDRIYDEVVSRMVRAGQMEAHNFDELLCQVAEEVRETVPDNLFERKRQDLFGSHEMGRWYLKESEITAVDAAESAKEDAAARNIREYISIWLADNLGAEGVHYSDIFEHYVYTVKDKPRRSLADWLLDYFYKTDAGTYRLPQSEEEEYIKTEARASGTIRRIKHYIAHLQQGTPVMERDRPSDATLAEWIRHCKRSGLYEQGKLLYERGGLNLDNLSEETLVNVEEDYQVCVRLLARNGGNTKQTGKRGKS